MNDEIRAEIAAIIAELHDRIGARNARRQYKPGKAQQQQLADLGILELMPHGFGFSDADAVLRAATDAPSAVMNRYGEGEGVPESKLYRLLKQRAQTDK